MLRSHKLSLIAGAAFAAALGLSGSAQAANVPCSSLTNPLYGIGGSAITPTFKLVAAQLLKANPPITLVYQDPSACTAYDKYVAGGALTGTARYWDATATELACDLPTVGGPVPVFATMGNSVPLCANRTLPSDVGDFEGPIQTVNIVTARASSETSISAEALHYIFGKGDNQVAPWSDEAFLVKRAPSSFVHLFVALAAQVPAQAFKGDTEITTNQATVDSIATLAAGGTVATNGTLGYTSGPNAELAANATLVKTLAYQHLGQTCGYWPNSSESARDKVNVRNGQYYLWAPNHFYTKVAANTREILDGPTKTFIRYLTGAEAPPAAVELNKALVNAGNVPQCAMQVKRAGDLGAISSWAPLIPCACTFEKLATGSTACQACPGGADSECTGGGKCRDNYCEAY